jgi:hypothetical protein
MKILAATLLLASAAYAFTTVATGRNFTILLTAPDPGGPNFGYVINNEGTTVISEGSESESSDQLLALRVKKNEPFYYSCRGPFGTTPAQSVSVFSLEPGVLAGTVPPPANPPTPVVTSTDPDFVQSVCN